jgi:hypothetical protein
MFIIQETRSAPKFRFYSELGLQQQQLLQQLQLRILVDCLYYLRVSVVASVNNKDSSLYVVLQEYYILCEERK